MKALFLQIKFFLVEFLNITYQLIPNPLRNYYLKIFGISLGGSETCLHRRCKFFHVGKMKVGKTQLSISDAT